MGFLAWFTNIFKKNHGTSPAKGASGKALLVGINAYPGAPLSGCLNDVANTKNMLMTNYGFSQDQIVTLRDGEATTANVLAKLDWLVDVKPGDAVFFHYSGHGAQVPTDKHLEADGLSECICPVDFNWTPPKMITDKQFVGIFSRLPAGARLCWLSDSCHSGDLSREIASRVPSRLSKLTGFLMFWRKTDIMNNKTLAIRQMPIPDHVAMAIIRAKMNGHRSKGMTGGMLDVGFISGCKSNQTSADAWIDGAPCGAATHFFLKALKSRGAGAPLTEIVAEMNLRLKENNYEQQPQSEGARAGKPFLA